MAEKKQFTMVIPTEPSYEEKLDDLEQNYRKKTFKRVVSAIFIVLALILGVQLWMALRSFDSYEVLEVAKHSKGGTTQYVSFQGKRAEYNSDGIVYLEGADELIWNQSFEMSAPQVDICGDYLAIYDQGGTAVYIMSETGLVKKIETSMPISRVRIAGQGTVAILMKEENASYVRLYDRKGKQLANGEFFLEKGSIPIDIAFSSDAQKLAVASVDVNEGSVKSLVQFFNFGSVGQNEIDNQVGIYTYENELIPEIFFVGEERFVALTSQGFVVFEGDQKPTPKRSVDYKRSVQSVFYNQKYIGITYRNEQAKDGWHIQVYDWNGNIVMENDTLIPYQSVELLESNEVCVRDANRCEIFTIHSIKKFSYAFEQTLCKVLSGESSTSYTFVFENETNEVRLD